MTFYLLKTRCYTEGYTKGNAKGYRIISSWLIYTRIRSSLNDDMLDTLCLMRAYFNRGDLFGI